MQFHIRNGTAWTLSGAYEPPSGSYAPDIIYGAELRLLKYMYYTVYFKIIALYIIIVSLAEYRF